MQQVAHALMLLEHFAISRPISVTAKLIASIRIMIKSVLIILLKFDYHSKLFRTICKANIARTVYGK